MGVFKDFLEKIFQTGNETVKEVSDTDSIAMSISSFADSLAVDLISNLVSTCEFRTFISDEEEKSAEYYRWNYSPNANQSGADFKKQLVKKLLEDRECLVFANGDEFYIADSFSIDDSSVLYPARFRNVVVKGIGGTTFQMGKIFSTADAFYFRMDDDSDVLRNLRNLEDSYSTLLSMAASKYKRASGRKGVLSLAKTLSGDQEKQNQERDYLISRFRNYYSEENGMVVLQNGQTYTEQPSTVASGSNEISNISRITKEAISRAAQVRGIPPALLLGEMADLTKAMDQALTLAIDPLVAILETEINRKQNGRKTLDGNYLVIDTSCIKHVDIFSVAGSSDKLIASGVSSVDEIRILLGMRPLGTKWSTKHWMTKNYQALESVGIGGEE